MGHHHQERLMIENSKRNLVYVLFDPIISTSSFNFSIIFCTCIYYYKYKNNIKLKDEVGMVGSKGTYINKICRDNHIPYTLAF